MPLIRKDDPEGLPVTRKLGPETHIALGIAVLVCGAMLGAQAKIINLINEFKEGQEAIRREMVTIDDAVAIQRAAIEQLPDPVRASVAMVNVRDIIAEERKK